MNTVGRRNLRATDPIRLTFAELFILFKVIARKEKRAHARARADITRSRADVSAGCAPSFHTFPPCIVTPRAELLKPGYRPPWTGHVYLATGAKHTGWPPGRKQ